ncbi:hypothetical protein RIF29_23290 [Crotalaria pallida]|uniref:Phytocyanin domain-containing protein n=1 Tax=Crotalaria pallida TaxID=3830 RepID=A0AAN9FA83_CROPI
MAMVLLFFTVLLISLSVVSMSAVYRVGDSVGWTILDHPDYKNWASSKKFYVGDTLIFSYHKQNHDVMEVSQHDYIHCNTNSAKAFYHTGSDSINLTKTGDFYFICSNSGHCLAGQKVHIKQGEEGGVYNYPIRNSKRTFQSASLLFLTLLRESERVS